MRTRQKSMAVLVASKIVCIGTLQNLFVFFFVLFVFVFVLCVCVCARVHVCDVAKHTNLDQESEN